MEQLTEKRFDYTAYDDGTESIYDRENDKYYFDMQLSNIEELLNDLADENEQLKGEVAHYKLILMSLEQQAKRMSSIRRNKND